MAEHDDELDRRIRRTVSLAGADALPPGESGGAATAAGTPNVWGRRVALAAAALLVLGAVGVLAARTVGAPDEAADEPSTTVAMTATSVDSASSTSASTTTAVAPADCDVSAITSYDETGTMHTVVPSAQTITVSIEPGTGSWCPGGDGSATVSMTNTGAGAEDLAANLILSGGVDKWTLTSLPAVTIPPGDTMSIDVDFDLPPVAPGDYVLAVHGFAGSAPVTIAGPPVCSAPDLRAAVLASDGAMGTIHTIIEAVNGGAAPCLLPGPLAVFGGDGSDELTLLATTAGPNVYSEPRATNVLAPGGRAVIDLATGNGCLDGSVEPTYWTTLELSLSPTGRAGVTVELTSGSFQTVCELTMSDWMEPSP